MNKGILKRVSNKLIIIDWTKENWMKSEYLLKNESIEWIEWINWWILNELMGIERIDGHWIMNKHWIMNNNVWVNEKWMGEWILNELKNIEWINEYWMNLWIEWIDEYWMNWWL